MIKKSLISILFLYINSVQAAPKIPIINEVNAISTTFKFTAILSSSLPKGNAIKIDYGKGFKNMKCADKTCSITLTSNVLPIGESLDYQIGIFDSKSNQLADIQTGTYSIIDMSIINNTVGDAAISNIILSGTIYKFIANLDAPMVKGYNVKIDYGNGLKTMTCSGKTCTLSTNALPVGISASYKVGIYKDIILQGELIGGNYTIASNLVPQIPNYTKISNTGSELPDTATDWHCTKDKKTGLIWEVKTDDGSLNDKDWIYSWYEPDKVSNKNEAGKQNGGVCNDINCDSYSYRNAANKQQICGSKGWRLPTRNELLSLVYCSDGKYQSVNNTFTGYICTNGGTKSISVPTINTNYFPSFLNRLRHLVWSSTQDTKSNSHVYVVDFEYGYLDDYPKYNSAHIILVHK